MIAYAVVQTSYVLTKQREGRINRALSLIPLVFPDLGDYITYAVPVAHHAVGSCRGRPIDRVRMMPVCARKAGERQVAQRVVGPRRRL